MIYQATAKCSLDVDVTEVLLLLLSLSLLLLTAKVKSVFIQQHYADNLTGMNSLI